MAIIYIDGKAYEVKPGKNLLETCITLGFDLPYFCWHPAMGSVGACRQCAIKLFKDENDTKGRLVMACMEPVKDNAYLSLEDPHAKAFRSQNIEWLMTNHPHDCAVCDEGGSCHLQDMTVMTGHTYRRFAYKKRTYNNQHLGPFINHEMNRCIQCYRCVRFYKDYAGGKDLDVFAAHNHVYFGRERDGILENEFSGNLAEICPTGVFTDKTFKAHYTRKWDLTMAPSICQHCGLGCNIIAGERYGTLLQITNRFNASVNGYFICDRGRFGYEFVNSINRVQRPLIRANVPDASDKYEIYAHIKSILSNNSVIGVGSPRASLESNFALMQLVGKENFYQGVSEAETQFLEIILQTLNSGHVHVPSIKETELADVILVLGEDLTNSAPRLALSIRQAVYKTPLDKTPTLGIPPWHDNALRELIQQKKGELIIANPTTTKLDEIASQTFHTSPENIAILGFAIAHYLNPEVPIANDIDTDILDKAQHIAETLKKATKPLIISGISCFNAALLKAASNIAYALENEGKKSDLCFVVAECNSMGLAMMQAPSMDQATDALKNGKADTIIVLENDLYRRGNQEHINQLFNACKQIIVIDQLHNETTNRANVLIPAATFAESDGTIVNNEGRAQRFFRAYIPKNENIRESWRWLDEFWCLKNGVNAEKFPLSNSTTLMTKLGDAIPWFKGAEKVAPPREFRIVGQKIPREPHRYSGRTAMFANLNVNEPKPPQDDDSALSFSMEGYRGQPPSSLTPFYWSPGWNSVQSLNKYQKEVGGVLHDGDPGKRLFNEVSATKRPIFYDIPKSYSTNIGAYTIIPLPHIFGSEELSIYSPGIAEMTPKPYLAIGTKDALKLSVETGEMIHLQTGKRHFNLPIKIKEELLEGTAGIPFNIPNLIGINWPATGILTKVTI